MLNLHTKFEVSRCTRYKAMNGSAKCRKWGGLGTLKVIGNITILYSAYDFLFQKLCIDLVPFLRYSQLFVESC